ncbi:hypothetical protein MHU86_20973 [Fragilaria crotonensis]|nr:hypothetical protein MHU86_20973 [Fragilaria crotonensis]
MTTWLETPPDPRRETIHLHFVLLYSCNNSTEHQTDVFNAMWRGFSNGQRAVLIPLLQSLVVEAGLGVNPFAMTVMMSDEMQDFFRHTEGTESESESVKHASNVSKFYNAFSDLSVDALREILAMIGDRPPQCESDESTGAYSPQFVGEKGTRLSTLTGDDTTGRPAGVASSPKEE